MWIKKHLVGQFSLSENGKADSQGGVEAQTKLAAVPTDLTLETEAIYAQTSKLNS
ncbi:hypothetical protein IH992_31360 [Candidatus Poribacteria bacterium]|nr:hypothetical protein [Candidatus Poribacteria bacterium]